MAPYHEQQLKISLFHAKAAARCLEKACAALGVDPDEPLQQGLAPRPPDDDIDFPDHVEPTLFDDEIDDNPQSGSRGQRLRLVRALASYRQWQ